MKNSQYSSQSGNEDEKYIWSCQKGPWLSFCVVCNISHHHIWWKIWSWYKLFQIFDAERIIWVRHNCNISHDGIHTTYFEETGIDIKFLKSSFLYNVFSLTKFYGHNFYIGILFKSVGPKLRGDILPHNKCFLKLNLIYSNLFKENFLLLKWTFLDIVSIPPLPLEKTCSDICFQKVFPHPLIWTFHGWSEGGPQQ